MKHNNLFRLGRFGVTFALLTVAALVGCGGGSTTASVAESSSEGATGTPSPEAKGVSFVSKGPITGATCTLYKSTDKSSVATVNSAAGNVDYGTVNYSGGVYAKCIGGTYTDEATGATVNNTVIMSSAGVITANQPFTLVVTPLTTMAWNMSDGDPSAIVAKAAIVAQAFGLKDVNILLTKPTDLNLAAASSDSAGQYGTVLASIAQLQKDQGADLASVLTALGNGINTNGTMTTSISSLLKTATENLTDAGKNTNPAVRTNAAMAKPLLSSTIAASSGLGTSSRAGGSFSTGNNKTIGTRWVTDNAGLLKALPLVEQVFGCSEGLVAWGPNSQSYTGKVSDYRILTSIDGLAWTTLNVKWTDPNAYIYETASWRDQLCIQNKMIVRLRTTGSPFWVSIDAATGNVKDITAGIMAALPQGTNQGDMSIQSLQNGNRIVAFDNDDSYNQVAISDDAGESWSAKTLPAKGSFQEHSANFSTFISDNQELYISQDGLTTWKKANLSKIAPANDIYSYRIHKTTARFTALRESFYRDGKTVNVATSLDGETWQAASTSHLTAEKFVINYIYNWEIAFVGNTLVTRGSVTVDPENASTNASLISTDGGVTWRLLDLPVTGTNYRFRAVNNELVLSGVAPQSPYKLFVYTSANGTNWQALTGVTPLPSSLSDASQSPYGEVQVVTNLSGSIRLLFNRPNSMSK